MAAVAPTALVDNTISFPLGLSHVKSGAASPLPGYLLAQTGHPGHLVAVGLLVLSGLAVALSLVIRPPMDCRSATWRLIIGLVLMFSPGAGQPVRLLHLPGRPVGVDAGVEPG